MVARSAVLAVACIAAGCVVPSGLLEERPCPCAPGWLCDGARAVCVRDPESVAVATTCWLRAEGCDWSVPSAFEFIEDGIRVGVTDADNPQFSPDSCSVYYALDGDLFFASRSSPGGVFGLGVALVDLNTAAAERRATIGPDGLEILFNRVAPDGVTNVHHSRRATTTSPWPDAPPAVPLNAVGVHTFDIALAPLGLQVYFSRQAGGEQEIYAAQRASLADAFDTPRMIPELSMTGRSTTEPSVTVGERVITFTRGGDRDRGLFYATRTGPDDVFGDSRSLPGPRLGVGDELAVAVSPDGCELVVRRSDRDGFYHQVYREIP